MLQHTDTAHKKDTCFDEFSFGWVASLPHYTRNNVVNKIHASTETNQNTFYIVREAILVYVCLWLLRMLWRESELIYNTDKSTDTADIRGNAVILAYFDDLCPCA